MKKKCEVLVVGGGVAGLSAAVAAAREGAHTILLEKNNFPGGIAVTGLHRYICGLFNNGEEIPDNTLNKGIVREITIRLKALAPEKTVLRQGRVFVLPFTADDLVSVFRSLSEDEDDLELLYNTRAVSVETGDGEIKTVTARYSRGEMEIIPQVVVDCSGDGIIIQLSGVRYRISPPHQRQFAGYTFRVKGILPNDDLLSIKVPYHLSRAIVGNRLPVYLKYTAFIAGDEKDEGYLKLSIPPEGGKERNKLSREGALSVHHYLSHVLPEFRKSFIDRLADEVVDREGPCLIGGYTLTADDVLGARKFTDGVTKNAWPIEFWDQETGPRYRYLDPGKYYEIPARCLKAEDISNLYCAGRCISVSPEALGSTRVMGTCISLGEVAGRAATNYLSGEIPNSGDNSL